MTTLVEAVRAYPLKGEQNKIDVVGQQEGNTRRLEGILGTSSTVCDTSSRTNQKMVPGTLSTSHHSAHLNPPTLGGPNDAPLPSSTRQLASSIPLSAQNHHPFPSFLPLPPPVFSPMLTLLPENPLRRPNKLRKPSRISPTPPVLAPLSFIEEPELDVDFEHISHDVQHTSFCPPRQQSLTNKTFHQQDAPPPDLCERPIRPPSVTRRLTKRRRMSLSPIPQAQIVSSSSGAAAAAAATGNPAAPVAAISQISSPISTSTPHRAQSDVGHGLRSSLSVKRSNIIRRLSMRSPKHSLDAGSQSTSTGSRLSGSTGFTTLSSGSIGRWSRWRGTASDSGHNSTNDGPPVFLPLVRVTSPLSVTLSSQPNEEDRAPKIRLPPVRTDLSASRPCSPTASDPIDLSNPISVDPNYSRPRAKFTLEENDSEAELSNSHSGTTTPPTRFTDYSQSPPPSRTHSTYNPHFLSPLSRHEPRHLSPKRRWTFAMAMTDEEITDEVLVEELEQMRLRQERSGSADDVDEIWDADYILFGSQVLAESPQEEFHQLWPQREHSQHNLRHPQPPADLSYTPSLPSFPLQHRNSVPLPGLGPSQHWQTARRVLLTCRELVRTERHYLASLQALLASETETIPPPLMLKYAEDLARVSELYLTQMEGNPSAWGVAAAFVSTEDAISGAFARWCGVVGMWFDDESYGVSRGEVKGSLIRGRKLSKSSKLKLGDELSGDKDRNDEAISGPLKKISSWRKSLTSVADLSTTVPTARKRGKGGAPPPAFSLNGYRLQRRHSNVRKPPLRDLAILPTQRIMRYVLLYRDLLEHTPSTSPARALIKRAADAALRIAHKCDRAQNNSAFIIDHGRPTAPAALTATSSSGSDHPAPDLAETNHTNHS